MRELDFLAKCLWSSKFKAVKFLLFFCEKLSICHPFRIDIDEVFWFDLLKNTGCFDYLFHFVLGLQLVERTYM